MFDNILLSFQNTMDTFGSAVVVGVQTGLQNTYVDAMKNILVPAYEKSSEDMFRQIQETFANGLAACKYLLNCKAKYMHFTIIISQFVGYTDMNQLDQNKPIYDELTGLLQALPAQLKAANDSAVISCTSQMNHDIQRDLKAMQVNLVKTIRDNVKNEVNVKTQFYSLQVTNNALVFL